MSVFNGTWKLVETLNLECLLESLGIFKELRDKILNAPAINTFTVTGDHFHVKHEGLMPFNFEFDIGKDFKFSLFGKELTLGASKEHDTKIIYSGKCDLGEIKLTFEVVGDQMTETIEFPGDKKIIRKFQKQ